MKLFCSIEHEWENNKFADAFIYKHPVLLRREYCNRGTSSLKATHFYYISTTWLNSTTNRKQIVYLRNENMSRSFSLVNGISSFIF